MAISFNTGATATLSSVAHTVNFTFTIPAGVNVGDVMVVSLETFTFTSAAPAVAVPSSGGGAWTQIGTLQDSGASGGVNSYATAWFRVATAADPGSAFTTHFTGPVGTSDQFWWAAAMGAYQGADTVTPVDVSGGAGATQTASITCPVKTTGKAGDWAAYLGAGAMSNVTPMTGPAGSTQRENGISAAFVNAALFDSNASVGGAGTSIGGGTFSHASTANWWGAFTVGLAPPAPAAGGAAPDRHHHRAPAGRIGQHRPGGRGGHR